MRIFSWNVNGIRAVIRKGLFLPFIQNYDPDILCLQETKAKKDQVEIDLANYTEYWNSAERAGYSGTAIFTKTPAIQVHHDIPMYIADKFNLEDKYGNTNNEGRVLVVEFEKFFMSTVYTPNAKDDLSRLPMRHKNWDPAFLYYMKELEKKKPVIFCGDLNVAHTEDDLARPKENMGNKGFTEEERNGFDKIIQNGFLDTFRMFTKGNGHYSWWTNWGGARQRNIGWRIDYFLVSKQLEEHIISAQIHTQILGSDHCPVSIEMDY